MTEVIVTFPDVDTAREVVLCAEMGMAHAYVDRERVREGIRTVRAAIADNNDTKG